MLKVIRKSFVVIDAFTPERPERTLAELTADLRMPKATVYNILNSLKRARWVTQDPISKRYKLGIRLWELGCLVVQGLQLRDIPRPHIAGLAQTTGETVHLSIIDPDDPEHVAYIDKIESEHPVRAYSIVGGRSPSYCVASGKAILAHRSDLFAAVLQRNLKAFTPSTLTDGVSLRREMHVIRSRGYALNKGEYRADVIGAAAPIRNHEGQVIAAVGISGPAYRMTREFLARCVPIVVATGDRISSDLGYRKSDDAAHTRLRRRAQRDRRGARPMVLM